MSNKNKNFEIQGKQISHFLDLSTYVFVRFILGILSILPYRIKITLGGLIYQKIISPLSGSSNPDIILSNVVFPHPLGPSKEKNSPFSISNRPIDE